MAETELAVEPKIPAWAQQAYDTWQAAIEATNHLQSVYNEWLSRIDELHNIPTIEQSIPMLEKIQQDMNQLYDLSSSFRSTTLNSLLKPLLTRQHEFNSRTVHMLNELLEYFRATSRQISQLMAIQIQYFQQITPWMDTKIEELRTEENHNVAYHIGSLQRKIDIITMQFYAQQSQLRSLHAETGSLHAETGTLQSGTGSLRSEINLLRSETPSLRSEINLLRSESASLRSEIESLQLTQPRNQWIAERFDAQERRIQEIWHQMNRPAEPKTAEYVQPENYQLEKVLIELEELKRQLALQERTVASPPPQPTVESKETIQDDFRYHVFEQIFRGTSEQVAENFRRYTPYFLQSPEPVLDLGCGRGEFLKVMQEISKKAYGVDMNEYEVQRLNDEGFEAVVADALTHIDSLPRESIGGVFCAQVVEHLPPEHVYRILSGLHRVMKPGSPLIMETVNPLSVFGFHHVYFKDPSHIFPVHPETLVFMLRYSGFQEVKSVPITPVPEQQKLQQPKIETCGTGVYEYMKGVVAKLNNLIYDHLEYYVLGYRA